jgi:MscS family membrane protein
MGKRRIKTTLGLTYSTTPEQISAILDDLKSYLQNNPEIDDETIFINFSGFGASTLDIFCYFFTKTTNWGEFMKVRQEVFLEFMKIITQKHQASFAFPSQSIYIEKGDLN